MTKPKILLFSITMRDWYYMEKQGWLSESGLKELRELEDFDKPHFCENCGEEEVEHEGDWCEDCNLPERSICK